jgi:hypothetical protein
MGANYKYKKMVKEDGKKIAVKFSKDETWYSSIYRLGHIYETQIRCQRGQDVMYFGTDEKYNYRREITFTGFHYKLGICTLQINPNKTLWLIDDRGTKHQGIWNSL